MKCIRGRLATESGFDMINDPSQSPASQDDPLNPVPEQSSGITRRKMLAASAAIAGASLFASESARATAVTEIIPGDTSPHIDFSLAGKSAIVTGAARGIGRAIALALAAAGADVMGIDIAAEVSPSIVYQPATPDELEETGKMVEKLNRRWIGVQADTRNLPALKAAVERANKEFGKVDIVVANAAIQIYGPMAETTDENWNDVINVNLTGTANTVRAVLPHMIPRKYGRIILISSGQGRHGFKNGAAYSASKWGIIGLMKSVALEVGEHQITVNTVEPGLVDTPMTRNPGRWKEALKEAGKPADGTPTEQEVIAARLPQAVMKIPWMQPDEVAPAVVFLASDAANRVTGATYDATAGDSARYTA
jgi:SDR family mycofactocin-dependent oxidoreductase